MFVPDTNIIIQAFLGKEPYASWLVENIKAKKMLLSAVVLAELLSGANKDEENAIIKMLNVVEVFSVGKKVAQIGGEYRRKYNQKSKKVWLMDCLIAATCKVHGATLVTYDKKDYPMKDIKILNLKS